MIEFQIKAICDKYIQQFNFGLVGKFRIFLKSFSKCCYSRLTYVWVDTHLVAFIKKKPLKGVWWVNKQTLSFTILFLEGVAYCIWMLICLLKRFIVNNFINIEFKLFHGYSHTLRFFLWRIVMFESGWNSNVWPLKWKVLRRPLWFSIVYKLRHSLK